LQPQFGWRTTTSGHDHYTTRKFSAAGKMASSFG